MFGLFKDRKEKQRKEAHELELRRSLQEKLAKYDQSMLDSGADNTETDTDFTQITVDGNPVRVRKNNITVHDLTSNTFFAKKE